MSELLNLCIKPRCTSVSAIKADISCYSCFHQTKGVNLISLDTETAFDGPAKDAFDGEHA